MVIFACSWLLCLQIAACQTAITYPESGDRFLHLLAQTRTKYTPQPPTAPPPANKIETTSQPKTILVLASYQKGQSLTDLFTGGITASIGRYPADKVSIEYEYMDSRRFSGEVYREMLRKIYTRKYGSRKLDLVITIDDDALDFYLQYADEIFHHTPAVFVGANRIRADIQSSHPVTGIYETISITDNTDLIAQLLPGVKSIIILLDKYQAKALLRGQVEEAYQKKTEQVNYEIWDDMLFRDLKTRLSTLPGDSAVLYLGFFRDAANEYLTSIESMELVNQYSAVPVFTPWENLIFGGVAGGVTVDAYRHGQLAGQYAVRILNGEDPHKIPVLSTIPGKIILDYNAIKRWGISSRSIPREARFLNKPFNLLEEYFWEVIGVALLLIIQSAIIILLFVNFTSRIRAEKQLRIASQDVQRITESVPDIIWSGVLTPNGIIKSLFLSPALERITGFPADLFKQDPSRWNQQIYPADMKAFSAPFERFRRNSDKQSESEYRFICANGQLVWLRSRMTFTIQADGGIRIDGIISDITKRKNYLLRLTLQYSISRILQNSSGSNRADSIEESIGLIMPEVCNALGWDAAALWWTSSGNKSLRYRDSSASSRLNRQEAENIFKKIEITQEDYRKIFLHSNANTIWCQNECLSWQCPMCSALNHLGLSAAALLPIKNQGQVLGIMVFYTQTDQPVDQGIQDFLESLAAQINLNIEAVISSETIRKNEVYNRALVEALPDLLLVFDRQGIFVDFKSHRPYFLFQAHEQIIGRSIYEIMPSEIAHQMMELSERLIITGELQSFEYTLKNPNTGLNEYFEGRMSVSGMEQFIVIIRDVTDRKQGELTLQKRADEFSTMFDTAREIALQRDISQLLNKVIDQTIRLLGAQGASLYIYTPEQQCLDLMMEKNSPVPVGMRLRLGEGLAGKVAQALQPMIIDDYSNWDGRYTGIPIDLKAVAGIPIQYGGELIGVLIAHGKVEAGESFSTDDLRLLSMFGAQVGAAIHNARLFEEKRRRLDQLQALREIDQAITSSNDLNLIFKVVLDQVIQTPHVDAADILVYRSDSNTLEYVSGKGFSTSAIEQSRLKPGQGHAGRALQEGRMITISISASEANNFQIIPLLAGERFFTYYAFPLFTHGQIKGVLEIFSRDETKLNQDWLSFLEAVAGQTAVAIDNARLLEGLQISNRELILAYDATLEGWARALELRDYETKGHTERVSELTVMLGKRMGMNEHQLVDLRRGALLHDVGKIGIPDSILLKPGKLTSQEWEIMRRHPVYALEMLEDIPYLKSSLEIPYYHHERWNGSGYPCGLAAEQIPFSARLFAVVDAWDALTSERPYRKAWSIEQAIRYLKAQAGIEFDPRVVDVFLTMLIDDYPEIIDLHSERLIYPPRTYNA